MQIITPAQCRAARALLNWSQPELAARCAIHVQTISNFEKESSTPSKTTLEKITNIFESVEIIFLSEDGVKRAKQQIKSYRGQIGFINFVGDVYETVKNGGDVFVSNVDENNFIKWEGEEAQKHMNRMQTIKNLNFQILIKEGDRNLVATKYARYKWLPEKNFEDISLYIYGSKTAFISFTRDNADVFVIEHLPITNYFKDRFKNLWDAAIMIE